MEQTLSMRVKALVLVAITVAMTSFSLVVNIASVQAQVDECRGECTMEPEYIHVP